MLLNCDLGEHERAMHTERRIMAHLHCASIACGGHAGNTKTMRACVQLALQHKVQIGAHPSYPDRAHFGRRSLQLPAKELATALHQQIATLQAICAEMGGTMAYIKPHGALYNDLLHNQQLREQVMQTVAESTACNTLLIQDTSKRQQHQQEAKQHGIGLLHEAFADRRYTAEGTLQSRSKPGAVLHNNHDIIAQAQQLAQQSSVQASDGTTLTLKPDHLCLHGDNPASVQCAAEIRAMLNNTNKAQAQQP